MSEPFFSVVIPTYNRAVPLKRCLNSLVAQTYKDFEVIVCDDGSTDDTKEVVEHYKDLLDIKYIEEENWGGPARPRNNGIKAALGEWICFLDSDDIWSPQKLEVIKNYTEEYDVISHGLDVIRNGQRDKESMQGQPLKHPVFDNLLLTENAICNSSISVRKSIVLQIGGVNEDKLIIGVEDYLFLLNVAVVTERFIQLPVNLGEYHIEDANIHKNLFQMYKGEMQIIGKFKVHKTYEAALKKRQLHYFPYLALCHKKEARSIYKNILSIRLEFLLGTLLLPMPLSLFKFLSFPFRKTPFFRRYSYVFN